MAPNALWSYLFFGLQPMLAGLEIIVLWLMIYETYLSFLKCNKKSLFIHTVFGLGKFYMVLNASIWWLNK
jgi:tryptophan-rich sensory protein